MIPGVEVCLRGSSCWGLSVHVTLERQPPQEQDGDHDGDRAVAAEGVGEEVVRQCACTS